MTRPCYDVSVTYTKEGPEGPEEVIEHYKSILELARAYRTTNQAISKYLNGTRKSNPLPEGVKVSLSKLPVVGYKKDGYLMWRCDVCEYEVLVGSKANHLNGVTHQKKVATKAKIEN